jgi:predicted molibdopterin-dependent oxidoreductase YjgC
MQSALTITVDGASVSVASGVTVAAALANAGIESLRRSVSGEPRGAVCAMGICHECRVTIDGVPHRRACMTVVAPNMVVERGADES